MPIAVLRRASRDLDPDLSLPGPDARADEDSHIVLITALSRTIPDAASAGRSNWHACSTNKQEVGHSPSTKQQAFESRPRHHNIGKKSSSVLDRELFCWSAPQLHDNVLELVCREGAIFCPT